MKRQTFNRLSGGFRDYADAFQEMTADELYAEARYRHHLYNCLEQLGCHEDTWRFDNLAEKFCNDKAALDALECGIDRAKRALSMQATPDPALVLETEIKEALLAAARPKKESLSDDVIFTSIAAFTL